MSFNTHTLKRIHSSFQPKHENLSRFWPCAHTVVPSPKRGTHWKITLALVARFSAFFNLNDSTQQRWMFRLQEVFWVLYNPVIQFIFPVPRTLEHHFALIILKTGLIFSGHNFLWNNTLTGNSGENYSCFLSWKRAGKEYRVTTDAKIDQMCEQKLTSLLTVTHLFVL